MGNSSDYGSNGDNDGLWAYIRDKYRSHAGFLAEALCELRCAAPHGHRGLHNLDALRKVDLAPESAKAVEVHRRSRAGRGHQLQREALVDVGQAPLTST